MLWHSVPILINSFLDTTCPVDAWPHLILNNQKVYLNGWPDSFGTLYNPKLHFKLC